MQPSQKSFTEEKKEVEKKKMISISTKILLGLLALLLVGFILLPSWLKWLLIVVAIVGFAVLKLYSDRVQVITNRMKEDVKTDFATAKKSIAKTSKSSTM